MGTDIHVMVETFDGARWRLRLDCPGVWKDSVTGWGQTPPVSPDPEQRLRRQHWSSLGLGVGVNVGMRPWPEDHDPETREQCYGNHSASWAPMATLLRADWADTPEDVGFLAWLRSPAVAVFADSVGGVENVRVLWMFDS